MTTIIRTEYGYNINRLHTVVIKSATLSQDYRFPFFRVFCFLFIVSCDLLSNSFQILEFGFQNSTCYSMALIYHFSR